MPSIDTLPLGFDPKNVPEVLLRFRDYIAFPPPELKILGYERNDELLIARRQEQNIGPGTMIFHTLRGLAGWTTSDMLNSLIPLGFRLADLHVEWRGENKDQPVLSLCLRRELGDDACTIEQMTWMMNVVLAKGWRRGQIYANPREGGVYQLAVDMTDTCPASLSLPNFPLGRYVASANGSLATSVA